MSTQAQSEPLNAEFAHRFTTHFAALAKKYPVYADLQNIFDLALVASLSNRSSSPNGSAGTCVLHAIPSNTT